MKDRKLDLATLGAVAMAVGANTSESVSNVIASNPDDVSAIIAVVMMIVRFFKRKR